MITSLCFICSKFTILLIIQASLPPVSPAANDSSKTIENKDNELAEMKLQLSLLQQQVCTKIRQYILTIVIRSILGYDL